MSKLPLLVNSSNRHEIEEFLTSVGRLDQKVCVYFTEMAGRRES
jgi:hypothetical protein